MATTQARRWCFTLNNYTDDECSVFEQLEVKSIIIGKEVGENNTPHLQGYIKFNTPKRLAALKKINKRAHWEKARGTDQDNYKYCSKENVWLERGVFESGEQGGGASQLKLALSCWDKKFNEMSEDEQCAYIRWEKQVERYRTLKWNNENESKMKERYQNAILKEWQQELVDRTDGEVNPRKVYWYVDSKGNNGKSYIADYLRVMKGAIKFENGKSSDIAYIYKNERIVIFDLSRTQEQYFNYGIIENFKNGYLFSPKYESCVKNFDVPHVIVFSNFEPDLNKLSEDRWAIKRFNN